MCRGLPWSLRPCEAHDWIPCADRETMASWANLPPGTEAMGCTTKGIDRYWAEVLILQYRLGSSILLDRKAGSRDLLLRVASLRMERSCSVGSHSWRPGQDA